MASMYDLCPKCGAVTKNGKCTSCGRLLVGKSSNSTMDKWRSESRQWRNSNKAAHQDHCTDHNADGNVYLNGKVIRKTSNYRSSELSNNAVVDEFEQDDILNYSNATTHSSRSSSTVSGSTQTAPKPQATLVTGNDNPFANVKVKKKKKGWFPFFFWLGVILLVFLFEFMEERGFELDDMPDVIYGWLDSDSSNYTPEYDIENTIYEESVEVSEDESRDSSNVSAATFSGNMVDFILDDPLECDWKATSPAEATEYSGSIDHFDWENIIRDDLDYKIGFNEFFYNNHDGFYNDENRGIYFPVELQIYTRYPAIIESNLDETQQDDINEMIRQRSAECAYAYEWYKDSTGDEKMHVSSYAYVTYMSEDFLSIAFFDYYYIAPEFNSDEKTYWGTRVSAINIDFAADRTIDFGELIDFPENFGEMFMEKCEEQQGGPVDYIDAEYVDNCIESGDFCILYTPVGYEVVVSSEDFYGWESCTFKTLDEITGK